MDHEWMIMRTGAGRYIQGENTSSLVGQELKRLGFHKVGIIAGKRAFEAAKQPLITGLEPSGACLRCIHLSGVLHRWRH